MPAQASSPSLPAVRKTVTNLLSISPAFAALPAESQKQLSADMTKVGSYLARPEGLSANALAGSIAFVELVQAVDFPQFVAGLLKGVFQAIVSASIEQMRAYAKLVAGVAKTVDQFLQEAVTDQMGRDYLVATYPEYFGADGDGLALKPDWQSSLAIERLRLLPLDCPIETLKGVRAGKKLIAAGRRQMAKQRQQLLATMVLMGMNR